MSLHKDRNCYRTGVSSDLVTGRETDDTLLVRCVAEKIPRSSTQKLHLVGKSCEAIVRSNRGSSSGSGGTRGTCVEQ